MPINPTTLCAVIAAAFYMVPSYAGYQDALDDRRRCENAGRYAQTVYAKKLKQPNYFRAIEKAPKWERELLDDKSEAGSGLHGQVTRFIWLEVFISDNVHSKRDAYESGWAICMDNPPEE